MANGQESQSPNQPDKGRIVTYRAGLEADSWWDAHYATIVGNAEELSGNPGSHTSAGSSVTGRQRKEEADDNR